MALIHTLPEDHQKRSTFIKLDLSSFASVKEFVKEFEKKFSKIDILINNAGSINDTFQLTKDGIELTFHANFLSHMYLSALLVKFMKDKSRVINLSSWGHTFVSGEIDMKLLDDTTFNYAKEQYVGFQFYCLSKLANIYHSTALSKYFERNKKNIKSVSIHPGAVYSEFAASAKMQQPLQKFIYKIIAPIKSIFFKDEFMGAQTSLHTCYIDYNNLVTEGYYEDCKLSKCSANAANDEKRLTFTKSCLKIIQEKVSDCPQELIDMLNA